MANRKKQPHHRGPHQVIARRITDAGYANPLATCHYCKRTLDKCGPHGNGTHRNGTPAIWHACHLVDGRSDLGYVLGCSACNQSAGIKARNANRSQPTEPHSERWC